MLNPKIEEYIQEICNHVKFKRAHKEIRAELINHIEEKIEDLIEKGIIEEEASKKALAEMGEAEAIGKQLNQSHMPKPEWSILIITILFSLFGLTIAYFLITYGINQHADGFKKTVLFTIIGYLLMLGLYLFDYKKLERYSKKIFIGVSAILFVQLLTAFAVNGMKAWISIGSLNFNIAELSLFLYVISLPTLLKTIDYKSVKGYLYLFLMLLIPTWLFFQLKVSMAAGTYFVVFTMFMIKSKIKLSYILSVVGITTSGFLYMLISEPYRLARFFYFINPPIDPKGEGWLHIQIENLLSSAGLMGNGFTFPNRTVPEVQGDFVLTYIIYTFGWIAGIILFIFILAFIMRIFNASKVVKDVYGSSIIQGFVLIFAMKFLWNILMIMGFAPIISVSLPFISYGGSGLLIQMAAIGLIMSIYRCKSLSYA